MFTFPTRNRRAVWRPRSPKVRRATSPSSCATSTRATSQVRKPPSRGRSTGPGQADRQTPAPSRRGRRAAHPGQQRRNPRQSAVPAAPRRGGVPLTRHVALAGNLPGHAHRGRPAAGALRGSARPAIHRTACLARRFVRASEGRPARRLLRRPAQSLGAGRDPRPRDAAGLGSGLGCGAIAVITDDCPVAVAASVLAYFERENAGQCGSCFNGTAAMAAVAGALRDGVATPRTSAGCDAGR